jgi:peptidoglycan/xylan/chitin deacetylase (PgdA/CDA1 family)
MHDGPARRIGTAAATTAILKALTRKGYDFVTLDELHALTGK